MSPRCIKKKESVKLLVHTGRTTGINQAFRTDSRQPLEKDASTKLWLSSCKTLLGTRQINIPQARAFPTEIPTERPQVCLQHNKSQGVTGNGKGKRRMKTALAREEQVVDIPVNRKLTDSGRPGGTNTSIE